MASVLVALVLSGIGYSRIVNARGGRMMMSHGMHGMMHGGDQSSDGSTQGNDSAGSNTEGGRVYASACSMCHAGGLAGAPKFGDKTAWGPRLEQGTEALYDHALHGYRAMPAKGGHMDLSDDQVKAAVDYMVKAVNGDK